MDTADALLATLARLGWVDWSLLAVLTLSVVVGLWRGFVFELMSLAGWIVAWIAAQWLSPEIAPHLGFIGEPGAVSVHATAFVGAFLAVLLGWSLLARLLRLLLHATPLSVPDRLLGAGFGVLRGAVLLLVVATVVSFTPAAQSQAWRLSHGAHWLGLSLQAVKPLLPAAAREMLPA